MTTGRWTTPGATPSEAMAEDFLYHLYRGTELLGDGRYDGAREELDRALRLQPRDAAAQDLLAKVYFKLGVYPRSIELYQDIVRQFPDRIPPRVNLALSYLKTGQMRDAVSQLLTVIERDPDHGRAWGYLGLAWSRLGEYAKAREAFARAGHEGMVRRMDEELEAQYGAPATPTDAAVAPARASRAPSRAPGPRSQRPEPLEPLADEGETAGGQLAASAPGDEIDDPALMVPAAPRLPRALGPALDSFVPDEPEEMPRPGPLPPVPATDLLPRKGFVPRGGAVELDDGALIVVGGCAARLDAGALGVGLDRGDAVARRGRDDGPFAGSPRLVWLRAGWAVIPPRGRAQRLLVSLAGEAVVLREECVAAFDGALDHENALMELSGCRLEMVSLRGTGRVALEVPGLLRSVPVRASTPVAMPPALLLGWVGSVTPQRAERPDAEVPRIELTGEGTVLVSLPRPAGGAATP